LQTLDGHDSTFRFFYIQCFSIHIRCQFFCHCLSMLFDSHSFDSVLFCSICFCLTIQCSIICLSNVWFFCSDTGIVFQAFWPLQNHLTTIWQVDKLNTPDRCHLLSLYKKQEPITIIDFSRISGTNFFNRVCGGQDI
jgi:hypothetical protein